MALFDGERWVGWCGALGCAIALLGCGGDDAGGTTSPGATTTSSTSTSTGSGGAGGATTSTGSGGAGGATTSTGGGGGSSVPLVDAALDGQCPAGSKPPDNGVAPGDDLHKVTLSAYPDAVCNDGSPAIMYVRRAASPAAETSWIIHLQAGGACNDWEQCRDRWCSYQTTYNAAKMSSKFAPMASNGSGMFSRVAANSLGPANEVYVYYCSSDMWLGRKADVELSDPDGVGPDYRLHFRGFDIIQAVDDALRKGVTSDDGVEKMPKLVGAERILFAGSSAGSVGQTHALDWWAARYPKAQTAGFFDASTDPLIEDITDAAFAEKLAKALPIRYTDIFVGLYDAHLDESCLAAHPGQDAYLCSQGGYVRLNHVTTPFFVRHDLTDPVQYKSYGLQGLSLDDFADSVRATMLRYDDLLSNALEKDAMKRAPGVHVSNCGQHIVALDGPWFGTAAKDVATVEEEGTGTPTTVHDALTAFISGEAFHAYDTHPSTKSHCVAVTDDQ